MSYACVRRTIQRISSHANYPGKERVIQRCLNELNERYLEGALAREEWAALIALLDADSTTGRLVQGESQGNRAGIARKA